MLTIQEVIDKAKLSGVHFGPGGDKVHLAYLAKLRLIPQAVRRKVDGKIQGCYPDNIVRQLLEIERLRGQGLTYTQIRYQLTSPLDESSLVSRMPQIPFVGRIREAGPATFSGPTMTPPVAPLTYLVIGLLLGYLLSTVNMNNQGGALANRGPEEKTVLSEASGILPIDKTKVSMLRLNDKSKTEPLYIIAIPRSHLGSLGETTINLAN